MRTIWKFVRTTLIGGLLLGSMMGGWVEEGGNEYDDEGGTSDW